MGQAGKVSEMSLRPWRLARPPPPCQPHAAAQRRGISRAAPDALQGSPRGPFFLRGTPEVSTCHPRPVSEHCHPQRDSPPLITQEGGLGRQGLLFLEALGPNPGTCKQGGTRVRFTSKSEIGFCPSRGPPAPWPPSPGFLLTCRDEGLALRPGWHENGRGEPQTTGNFPGRVLLGLTWQTPDHTSRPVEGGVEVLARCPVSVTRGHRELEAPEGSGKTFLLPPSLRRATNRDARKPPRLVRMLRGHQRVRSP